MFKDNHETHTACSKRIMDNVMDNTCCYCNPHDGCELTSDAPEVFKNIKGITSTYPEDGFPEHTLSDAPKEKDWEKEFREYFDKALRPKKQTMVNLDRELTINFIKNIISQALEAQKNEIRQLVLNCIGLEMDDKFEDFINRFDVELEKLNK